MPQEQLREVISAVIFLQSVSEIEVTPFEVLPMEDVTTQTASRTSTMTELVREKS